MIEAIISKEYIPITEVCVKLIENRWHVSMRGGAYTPTCFTAKDTFLLVEKHITGLFPSAQVFHQQRRIIVR